MSSLVHTFDGASSSTLSDDVVVSSSGVLLAQVDNIGIV